MNAHRLTFTRREFLKTSAAAALTVSAIGNGLAAPQAERKLVGIQVGAVSFLDEGTEKVLDILQQKGEVNALFVASFTYGRGIGGRQVPGQPLPDHGKQEYDTNFHGGNFATPHPEFYKQTSLKETRAPDHGDYDVLADVVPKAHRRDMKVYAWYEDVFRDDIPGIGALREIDLQGRRAGTLCPLNPDYRNFLTGLTEDYCRSYELDGLMWGSERQGPLDNALSARHGGKSDGTHVTCFCERHQKAASERGLNFERVKEGYEKLAGFVQTAHAGDRPNDGYFVAFWRLLLNYPELLAYEKLWTEGQQSLYSDIYRTAKRSRPGVQVGFHIWHVNSFSPFYRAEQDYAELAKTADFLKVVVYNNCGGPRYANYISNVGSSIFGDVPKAELLKLHNDWLGYAGEASLADLPKAGLSADYVHRETGRAVKDVGGKSRIYPGIDIDIPTGTTEKKTTPEDVYASTTAALKAGAEGVLFSRKYSEMKLANLEAGGKAVREFVG